MRSTSTCGLEGIVFVVVPHVHPRRVVAILRLRLQVQMSLTLDAS